MKTLKKTFVLLLITMSIFVGCSDDDNNDSTIEGLTTTSPYLICAGRNPGGVQFDFVINGVRGMVFNADVAATVSSNVAWDLRIQTYKGVAHEGDAPAGRPFFKLYSTIAQGIYITNVDSSDATNTYNDIMAVTTDLTNGIAVDTLAVFDVSSISKDTNGNLFYSGVGGLKESYDQMIFGETWKNPVSSQGKMAIFVIKTREGRHVKLMIQSFGAGETDIIWNLLD